MEKDNLNLKRSLVFQSFAPLFCLLTIKHCDMKSYYHLFCKFFNCFINDGIKAFSKAVQHSLFGGFVVTFLGILWLMFTIIIALGFNGIQKSDFRAVGEKIKIEEIKNDNGATFLVTYVLPLLTNKVESCGDLMVFLAMLIMVIKLLSASNLFYQNPILVVMKYKTFSFRFINPANDISDKDRVYIGITHGKSIREKTVIKRKHISDGVFLIYND